MKIKKILLNNLGLKIAALFLAFVTWFYVSDLTEQDSGKTVLQRLLSQTPYISKKLMVKPIFVGDMPEGYVFKKEEVKVIPESMVVLGPAGILSTKEVMYTTPIDLSEHTKGKMIEVGLANINRSIKIQKTKVQVFIPVEKNEGQQE